MPSKADQWKRLHSLMVDPELVYAVEHDGSLWVTDRYVMVNPSAARQWLRPEPGTWRLRQSGQPVETDPGKATPPSPRLIGQQLGKLAALSWEPADVTGWALPDRIGDATWRLLVSGDEPVLMNDEVIRSWPRAFPEIADTVLWHAARFTSGARVVRATLRHDYGTPAKCGPSETVFGYLMGTRRQEEPLPPFPKLVTS